MKIKISIVSNNNNEHVKCVSELDKLIDKDELEILLEVQIV